MLKAYFQYFGFVCLKKEKNQIHMELFNITVNETGDFRTFFSMQDAQTWMNHINQKGELTFKIESEIVTL